jgi:flagellar M-ring protein FliF
MPGTDLMAGWRALPVSNKIATMVGIAASVAILTAAWLWSQAPDYKVLVANMQEIKDGPQFTAQLDTKGIPYKVEGNTIQVPAGKLYSTRLAMSQFLPKSGGLVGNELLDIAKIGISQQQETENLRRALEGELTKTILSIEGVHSVRVHLGIPKTHAFLREPQVPTASVTLSLGSGTKLERGQIAGIMHLVASALPGLQAKNVAVIDQNANLVSPKSEGSANGTLDSTQLVYVQELEQGYNKRIMEVLVPLYGENNVRAQVTAELDFSQVQTTSEKNANQGKSDGPAIVSQQISQKGGAGNSASGVPGTLTNRPGENASAPIAGTPTNPAAGNAGANAASQGSSESTTNYAPDKTISVVKGPASTVKRLSAAVVVNHKKPIGGKPGAAPLPLSAEEIAKVDALVKEAMGFSKDRGDSINVVNAPFSPREVEVLPDVPLWKQPDVMATAKEFGKLALIAGVVLYILLGVLRPMLRQILAHRPPEPTPEEASAGEEQQAQLEGRHTPALPSNLDNARALAKQDPKVVANVVRNWVNGNE